MPGADLYDELIMDHIRHARNYRVLDPADLRRSGFNPLCGDDITVYLRIEQGRIGDIAFQCTCCGISMASASIMTEMMMGRDAAGARGLLRAFAAALEGRAGGAWRDATGEQRAILATVRKFPARARCAALPWTTLDDALGGPTNPEPPRK